MTAHTCIFMLRVAVGSEPTSRSQLAQPGSGLCARVAHEGRPGRPRANSPTAPQSGDTNRTCSVAPSCPRSRSASTLSRPRSPSRARRQPAATAPATAAQPPGVTRATRCADDELTGPPPATTRATAAAAAHSTLSVGAHAGDGRKAMTMTIDASDIDVRRLPRGRRPPDRGAAAGHRPHLSVRAGADRPVADSGDPRGTPDPRPDRTAARCPWTCRATVEAGPPLAPRNAAVPAGRPPPCRLVTQSPRSHDGQMIEGPLPVAGKGL